MRARAISASGSTGPPTNTCDGSVCRSIHASSGSASCSGLGRLSTSPERPFVVVLEHVDHRAVEVRILEWWGGQEQPPLGRWAPREHRGSIMPADCTARSLRRRCARRSGTVRSSLHGHAYSCMIMRWAHGPAIIGASGYTGAELLRLLAGHPDLQLTVATGDTQAGTPIEDLFPSLAATYGGMRVPGLRARTRRRRGRRVPRPAAPGEHGARPAARRAGRVRRRPLGRLPAQGRLALPGLVRLRARPARAAGRSRVRAARAPPRRSCAPPGSSPPPAATSRPPRCRWRRCSTPV